MGGLSIWHILILGVIVLLLFGGRGKISDVMGDVARGITSFRKGLKEDEDERSRSVPSQPLTDRRDEKDNAGR
ncbi:MAG TPA: twin-arginine translocase TatA/TatE family subunit [Rhizomicrobium sp.]|jgi:sec-independent protein translocase protein TatA|nr:twin-arginine translocase TatA/TatE family subunit [Rhizomicrobium sp.]